MNQIKRLRKVITESEINRFKDYKISKNELDMLQDYIRFILQNTPSEPYKCASLSSFLGAIIKENTRIPVTVVSGGLSYLDHVIFDGKNRIPSINSSKVINLDFFGHCWVECPNLIIDISLIRTINLDSISKQMKQVFLGEDYVMNSVKNLKSIGLKYTPYYQLDDKMKNGLIRSITINK